MSVTPIAIADPPLRSSYGLHAPYSLRTVIQLRSEDGITGIAEAHGGEKAVRDFEAVKDLVIGSNAYELSRLHQRVEERFEQPSTGGADRSQLHFVPGENPHDVPLRISAALETAALDLIGKATGVPLCDLLGGRVRAQVPFSAYLFYKHAGGGGEPGDAREDLFGECLAPDAIVRQARHLTAMYGFRSYKLKAGVLPPHIEADTILALRDGLGEEAPLRIDPNSAWSLSTALEVAKRLHGVLQYLEDPVATIEGMGRLHQAMADNACSIPLASNVAVTNFADIAPAVAHNAVQIVLGDHHYWGGPRSIGQLGRMCEIFNLGLSMHSNSHLGVSLMAMAHVAAATPRLTYACDTHYPWQFAEDEIVEGGRIPIVDGMVRIPSLPGLGVTLDGDQLARGRERYDRISYRKRDDVAEMRKHVDATWTRMVPAW